MNQELEKKYDQSVSQLLSYEESAIDALLAKIESSNNPTLDLIHLMELVNAFQNKVSIKLDSGKNVMNGRYTLNDTIPTTSRIVDKVFNSKLNNDQKLLLLHIYGDKNPSDTLSKEYQNLSNKSISNREIDPLQKKSDNSLNL